MGSENKITNLEQLATWMRSFLSGTNAYEWFHYWSKDSKWMNYELPTDETFWILREKLRLEYGHYKQCCFYSHSYPLHFLHISQDNPELVAYTPDEKYGRADRQIRIKLGRYLTRFYPQLNENEIKYWVDRHRLDIGAIEYKVARTAEDIERVYRNGPNSCMSKSLDEYESHVHPSHVYAGPDTAVAYIEMENGDITARTVIVPDKKYYIRVYGHAVLAELLKNDGYTQGSLEGCRLQRIDVPGRDAVVMPYLDDQTGSAYYVIDEGDYMRVNDCEGIEARKTDGILYLDGRDEDERECYHCGGVWHEDDMTSPYDDPVCPNCLADRYVQVINGRFNTQWMSPEDSDVHYIEATGNYYTDYGLERNGLQWSERYEEYVFVNECVEDNNGDLIRTEDAIQIWDAEWENTFYQHVDDLDDDELFVDPTAPRGTPLYSINEPEDTVRLPLTELAEHMAARNPDLLRGNEWNYAPITALLAERFGSTWQADEPLVEAIARELRARMSRATTPIVIAVDYSLAA